jgi:hypothetical protein
LTPDSAYVKSDGEWLARSIVQGFFLAPIESLPEVSVTDVVCGSMLALQGIINIVATVLYT